MANSPSQRRSRIARLDASTANLLPTPPFAPDQDGWQRIADAYGVELSAEDRDEIQRFIVTYFDWVSFEAEVTAIKGVDAEIAMIEPLAATLRNKMLQSHGHGFSGIDVRMAINRHMPPQAMPPDPIREHQRNEGLAEIEAELEDDDIRQEFERLVTRMGPAGGSYFEFACQQVNHLLEACSAARRELAATTEERRGFEAGKAWDQMIRDLLGWAKSRRHPATLSMGRRKSANVALPSPFVRFVQELQNLFPDGYARHQHSVDGLAGAISRARRQRRGKARNTSRTEAKR